MEIIEEEKTHETAKLIKEPSKNTDVNELFQNKWLLCDVLLISFFATLCQSGLASFFTRNYLRRGGTYILSAVIFQIHPIAIALTGWIFGKTIPKFGHKYVAICGVLLESFSQIGFAFCSYITDINIYTTLAIICRFLSGIGNAAAITAIYTIGATHFGNQATFVVSLIESVTGISYLLGAITITALFALTNTMVVPLLIPGILYLISVGRFAIFHKTKNNKDLPTEVNLLSVLHLLKYVEISYPVVVIASSVGIYGYLLVYFTAYLKTIHMTVVQSGTLLSLGSICYIIGCLVSRKISSSMSKYTPFIILIALICYATTFLCFTGQTQQWIPYIGMIALGCFASVAIISSVNYSLNFVKDVKFNMSYEDKCSTLAGIWTSSQNVAKFLFALAGGLMIKWTGSIATTNFGLAIFVYVLGLFVIVMNLYIRLK